MTPSGSRRPTGAGIGLWLDGFSRFLLSSGSLAALVQNWRVSGASTNLALLARAVTAGSGYADQLRELYARGAGVDRIVRELACHDIRWACDLLLPVHDGQAGAAGLVCAHLDPRLAHDSAALLAAARQMWHAVDRPNLVISIPATDDGLVTMADCLAEGISVNADLIFSAERHRQVLAAHLHGVERALASGHPVGALHCVASVHVARIDAAVDALLDRVGTAEAKALRGTTGLACARLVHAQHVRAHETPAWEAYARRGARHQRLVWASLTPHDPAYADTHYVDALSVPGAVCTMPEQLLWAVADHGGAVRALPRTADLARDRSTLISLSDVGISLPAVAASLERAALDGAVAVWQGLHDAVTRRSSMLATGTVADPPLVARVPGSKSITNRALLLAGAAVGTSRLAAPLLSDDTLAFRDAVVALGAGVRTARPGTSWEVTGAGGAPAAGARVWCADAGTAARFLPPVAAAGQGTYVFDGSEQLRARPLRPLADALARLGADVTVESDSGLPLRIEADGLPGGTLSVDGDLSSQFLSGLLMAAPLMSAPLTLTVTDLVSRPYIDMTIALMRRFGAEVTEREPGVFRVGTGGYTATNVLIEPDASTASYFFAAAAVTGREVTVPGLGRRSLQGDLGFVDVLRTAGALVDVGEESTTVTGTGRLRGGFHVDMGAISDTFMTLAAIAPLADAPITIHGIGHARLKESDRIAAVAENLTACGVRVETGHDWLTVHPGTTGAARIACRRDHRIAMAFSVLGLRLPGLTFDDPDCVAKTFPGFHAELARLFPPASPSGAGSARVTEAAEAVDVINSADGVDVIDVVKIVEGGGR